MNCYHFLILGSEPRQYYLAELLRGDGHEVMTAEEYRPGYHDAVLLPVPETAKYAENNADRFQKGQIIFGCNFPEETIRECDGRGIRFVDYMKQEGVASSNAVATAEGAVVEALKEGCLNIHGSRALVVGYGRCGEVLAEKLVSLKAHVTVMERKQDKRARAETVGCRAAGFDGAVRGEGYDYVFNTVPAPVIGKEFLDSLPPGVTIIDIASAPGGVDFEYCRKKGIHAKLCPGLPGKYAPKSAAKILCKVIRNIMFGEE